MRVDWVSLSSFRSYKTLDWHPDSGVNVLIGPNGAGKTNLLEAISYVATLRSFRGAPDKSLIRDGEEAAVVRVGLVGDEDRERLIEIEIPTQGPRRTQVDKNRLRRAADLLGVVRIVAFLPEDLDLVKRGPSYRRDLLDSIAVQLWPAAYLDQTEYDKALRQRNAFLKAGDRDEATLSVWDSRLAQSGGRVLARRARALETIAPYLQTSYRDISQNEQEADVEYVLSWGDGWIIKKTAGDLTSEMLPALEASRRLDFDRRLTTVGPHRDEPMFRIDGVESRTHGSQGEQRSLALALKLASHRAVSDATGDDPLLLLDDVFSELDPERSQALADSLPADTQTMISSARPEDVPLGGRNWSVREGEVS